MTETLGSSELEALPGRPAEPEEEPPDEKDSPYASDYRSDRRKYSTELFGDDYD